MSETPQCMVERAPMVVVLMKRHLTRIILLGIETRQRQLGCPSRNEAGFAPEGCGSDADLWVTSWRAAISCNRSLSPAILQNLDQDRGLGSDNSSSPARVGNTTRFYIMPHGRDDSCFTDINHGVTCRVVKMTSFRFCHQSPQVITDIVARFPSKNRQFTIWIRTTFSSKFCEHGAMTMLYYGLELHLVHGNHGFGYVIT